MQDLSYDFNDPVWEFNGLRFAVQVFTFENVYGLHPDACTVAGTQHTFSVRCDELMWAGGQERAVGSLMLTAAASERATTFRIEAHAPTTIRCVKLVLKGMPDGAIVNLRETREQPIPPDGLIYTYPSGWRGLSTPLVVLRTPANHCTYFRSSDNQVREKRFAFLRRDTTLDVELIFEETATAMQPSVVVPAWEVGTCTDPSEIWQTHQRHVEQAYNLLPWDERPDVPAWARKIALVAAIHCQHWTGYVFNDYAKVLQTLQWLASQLPPEQILAYLPGWEGRYYWQYGDYRPDPRLGGAAGFAKLTEGARALGIHVMPMFGINVVNRGLPNWEQWGAPAVSSRAGGVPGAGSVDWDGSRHYDHEWNVVLNPGAPTWQNRLVSQITSLVDTYSFDGVFLDISAGWANDPRYNTYTGVCDVVRRIREQHGDIFVVGEGWYDAVGLATPLVQSGHTDGVLHWHDEPYAPFFDTYNRSFGHLCLGDPGRDSTGVHELGYNPITRTPVRKGIIPTVTIVEDTFEKAPDAVMTILDDARHYAATFLQSSPSQSRQE